MVDEPSLDLDVIVIGGGPAGSAMSSYLAMNGYRVTGAADGERAIDELAANPHGFALILLDLLLPGTISGNDVRARQLADPELAGVPTIVVSACEPKAETQAVLKPDVWLEKPFRGEQLLSVVRKYVKPDTDVHCGGTV